MANEKPVKLAILWHMHQPNYQEPDSNRMVMPWVRLHAVKDYLDMALMAAEREGVKVTFNLVPALLDQIELYQSGATDRHLELSRISAEDLNEAQRTEILTSFFSANPTNMIEPHARYSELYRKARHSYGQAVLPALFTSEEMRDLQVWSNLTWVDPLFRQEDVPRSLFDKGRHYTEEEKNRLLDWQLELMGRVIPTYRQLYQEGRIDISFTPYYHPILPLLCDTNIARESMPSIALPKKRFVHPEDSRRQIEMSVKKFEALFGKPMEGMWPSEGSVSEEVAQQIADLGIKWIATDEEILYHSLRKSGLDRRKNPLHAVYQFGSHLKLLFRDHTLSDRIGFVYSGWTPKRAVNDFIHSIRHIRSVLLPYLDTTVITVILDGENAWEYFPQDGREFLELFYRRLDEDPLIETVTMTEAAELVKAHPLPKLHAGSWINHNFRIWIGHHEDNAAWDLLAAARKQLVDFQNENPDVDEDKIAAAWKQIYISEGSDWCWWFGDEHRGGHNEQFDRVFRRHLMAVYEYLGLEIPHQLTIPIYQEEAVARAVMPDSLVSPEIDGRLTYFYEWAGAGRFDCLKAGQAMHRVDRYISNLYFAFDHDSLYVRLDFVDKKDVELIEKPMVRLTLSTPETLVFDLDIDSESASGETKGCRYRLADLLEVAIKRTSIFERSYGEVGLTVSLLDGDQVLESWPEKEPISFEISEKNNEMFWPS